MKSFSMTEIEGFVSRFWTDPATGGPAQVYIEPYDYSATFTALAQAGNQTQAIQIQANADFLCLAVLFRFNVGAAQNMSTVTAPFVRLLVTDTGSSQQWTNTAQDLLNYGSTIYQDETLMYPRIVQGRSSLQLQLTSYAPTAETYSGDVMLRGVHIRRY